MLPWAQRIQRLNPSLTRDFCHLNIAQPQSKRNSPRESAEVIAGVSMHDRACMTSGQFPQPVATGSGLLKGPWALIE